ncbi:hypothetical protein FHS95_000160 [Sphingomonas naasensis]|uniref:Uncharacterized protein n=1 Tax=Sphingomonas naasensis TaxID=1344951 RepID=A0A4S1WVY1_9SPHN|nr:hypothetical protein [Sphingomonas naasensis]NIJ18491.1 hypothetical protein [Sphingomonas naasensis]TGX45746.1 hypothetical protein E5A74_00755 [Sphingomonas naasensis]
MRHPLFPRGLRDGLGRIVALACFALPAQAQEVPRAPAAPALASPAGEYRLSEMELVAGIRLNADGSFQYGLTVGALDESAQGRWEAAGNRIRLTSVPRPVAPTIAPARIETAAPGTPFAIRLVWPNGRDVPGVDLRIAFDSGEPLDSYLAGGPWSLPEGERRVPRFVTFSLAPYRLQSARLPLDAATGRVAMFTLTPNDFGVIDLSDVPAEIVGDTLVLHRPEGTMRFKRVAR